MPELRATLPRSRSAVGFAIPDGARGSVISGVWILVVALSFAPVPQPVVRNAAIIACVFCGALIAVDPATTLIALPFLALLSPLGGFIDFGGVRLVLSDLILLVLAVQLFLLFITNRTWLHRSTHGAIVTCLGAAFALSAVAGYLDGTLQSLKPVLYLIQFVIIYHYSVRYADAAEMQGRVINAWLLATALGALLLIRAYMSGVMLNDFDGSATGSGVDRSSLTYLFQATYYYTGFHYALGIGMIVAILKLFLEPMRRHRLPVWFMLPVIVVALIMMLNKTAMISAIAALMATFVVLRGRLPRGRMRRIVIITLAVAVASVTFVAAVFLHYLGDTQGALWTRQASGATSLIARSVVYVQAFREWSHYPLQMLIGMGPDFLDNSGAPGVALAFKLSSITGGAEGTVDSGWISYLLELGCIGASLLVFLFALGVRRTLGSIGRRGSGGLKNLPATYVTGGLFFTIVAMSTQMLGYAKISWLPFQLLVFALIQSRHGGMAGADSVA